MSQALVVTQKKATKGDVPLMYCGNTPHGDFYVPFFFLFDVGLGMCLSQ